MNRFVMVVSLIAFWAVAAAGAQTRPPQAGGNRVVSGVVLSSASGQPLAQADVMLRESDDLKPVAESTTDGDGRFELTGVPDGRFRLSASHRGYVTSAYQEHEGGIATAIVTGDGLDTSNLQLTLPADCAIYGKVTEDSGDPVPQARVTLYALDPGTGRMRRTNSAQADAMGQFDLPHLAPGNYYVCASGIPWYAGPRMGAMPGVHIPEALDMAYRTACNPDGTDPASAEPITVNPGDNLPIDLLLHPVPAVHISVQIPNGCGGRGSIYPQLRDEIFGIRDFVQYGFGMTCGGNPRDGNTTATAYSFGIAPGQYEIELNSFANGESQTSTRTKIVDAASGELTLDSSSFAAIPSLSGTVAVAGGSSLPIVISLEPAAGQADDDRLSARVEPDGSFHMNDVAPGKYEVTLAGREGALAVDHITAQGATGRGRIVELGSAAATLAITAIPADASVSGSVESAGKPASGVFLLLVPASAGAGRSAWRSDQSDSDGSFEFRHVAPGNYFLVAIEQGWNLSWRRPGVINPYLEKGVPVAITSSSARIVLKSPIEAQPERSSSPSTP